MVYQVLQKFLLTGFYLGRCLVKLIHLSLNFATEKIYRVLRNFVLLPSLVYGKVAPRHCPFSRFLSVTEKKKSFSEMMVLIGGLLFFFP